MTKKLLLVLAIMLLACSVLSAQTPGNQTAGGQWVPISARFWDGDRFRPLRPGARQGSGQRGGRHGAQSGSRQGYPVSHVDRPGVYRNVGSVYPAYRLHEGRLMQVGQAIGFGGLPACKSIAEDHI